MKIMEESYLVVAGGFVEVASSSRKQLGLKLSFLKGTKVGFFVCLILFFLGSSMVLLHAVSGFSLLYSFLFVGHSSLMFKILF